MWGRVGEVQPAVQWGSGVAGAWWVGMGGVGAKKGRWQGGGAVVAGTASLESMGMVGKEEEGGGRGPS